MPYDPSTIHPANSSLPFLTGRFEVELTNDRGWVTGSIEIVVRQDVVSVWSGRRNVAVINRAAFREWLIHPDGPLKVDDAEWSVQAGVTCLAIDGGRSQALKDDVSGLLLAEV